jgi:glucose/arabinose dehydrogenase
MQPRSALFSAVLALLTTGGAVAIAGAQDAARNVLKGEEAFGDWHADGPGVRRLLKVEDPPQPAVSESAQNPPDKVEMPEGVRPQLSPGFKAEIVASGIENPRVVRIAPNGDLFVADSKANQVRVYRLVEGSARPAKEAIFATGLHKPYGIAFYPPGPDPQWIYVANDDNIVRFPYRSGDLTASDKPEQIVDHIPGLHHWTRDLVFSADGKTMFLSVGSGSNMHADAGRA